MGIISGVVGSVIGANTAKKARKQAGQGFNFLRNDAGTQQAQQQGLDAGGILSGLLGLGGDQAAANQAFDTFRNSTGFQFRLGQGISGIEQSQAASGLLNSGSTLKGLSQFNQGLASSEFNNFLSLLSGVQSQGLNSATNIANAGQQAGIAQAGITQGQGDNLAAGFNTVLGGLTNFVNRPSVEQGRNVFTF